MKEFALRHPYLTTFFVIPAVVGGAVSVVLAIRGSNARVKNEIADAEKKGAKS